ncbi:Nucleotide modification associated domain 2 [compost metagenome]
MLLSEQFIYFGSSAAALPAAVLNALSYYKNARDYRRFEMKDARQLVNWLEPQMLARPNAVLADPIDFASTSRRFSATLNRMV